jgi:putative transposase
MDNISDQLARELARNCQTVEDIEDAIKNLFKSTLEEILEADMNEHLGYVKHDNSGDNSGNSRNGYSKKNVKTKQGKMEIAIPRDRNSEFEPKVVKKYQRDVSRLENQIITMYAKGMSTRDIADQIKELYGINVSSGLVSNITDRIVPMIKEWQSRPLDRVYRIVFLDAIYFNVRQDSRIVNKAAYTALGINSSGYKDILGIWIGDEESASFWLGVCDDLKSRGVEDILIVCKDGLSGFSEAVKAVFPQTDIQLCVIHQIRNSLKYVPNKKRRALMSDLKQVYQALTIEEAELAFASFKEKWGEVYPIPIRQWENNWAELTAYFHYPRDVRRLIYTTNTLESYHRQLRKVTKTKSVFPDENALRKILYLATMDILKKWTVPVNDWAYCMSQFALIFGSRIDMTRTNL